MKTQISICHRPRQSQGGFAVLIILILLCIMVLFVMANTATLNWLGRQVNVVDQHQTQRLATSSTNQPVSK
jgi:Tfp pilus assembly protein PilX